MELYAALSVQRGNLRSFIYNTKSFVNMKKSLRTLKMTTFLTFLGCGSYWLVCASPATTKFVSHFASKKLFTKVDLESAQWNPTSGLLTLRKVVIKAPPEAPIQEALQIEKVVVQSKAFTIKNEERILESLELHSVQLKDHQNAKALTQWFSALRAHVKENRSQAKHPMLIRQLRIFDIHLDDKRGPAVQQGTLVIDQFSSRPWLSDSPLTATFVGEWKDKGPIMIAGSLDLRDDPDEAAKDLDMTVPVQSFPEAQQETLNALLGSRDPEAVETFVISENHGEVHVREGEKSGSLVNRLKDRVLPFRLRSQFLKTDSAQGLLFNIDAPMKDGDEEKLMGVLRKAQQYLEGKSGDDSPEAKLLRRFQRTLSGVTKKTQEALQSTRDIINKTRETVNKGKELFDSTREAARRLFSSDKDKVKEGDQEGD